MRTLLPQIRLIISRRALLPLLLLPQVPCPGASNIVINVLQYRGSGGGYIKLSFKKVAGDGGLTYVGLAAAGTAEVSCHKARWNCS